MTANQIPTRATEPLHITVTPIDDGWRAVVESSQFKGEYGNGDTMEGAMDDLLFFLYDTHGLIWGKAERVCVKLN